MIRSWNFSSRLACFSTSDRIASEGSEFRKVISSGLAYYVPLGLFSIRAVVVKRFQANNSNFCRSRARASLRDQPLALPAWDQQEETEQSDPRTDRGRAIDTESKANWSHPSSREGHRCAGLWFCRCDSLAFVAQIVGAISLVQRNSVPSLHMRCIITASRRASATMAFFCPRRLAMFIAHAFSHDHFCPRVSMTCAAS